MTVIAMSALRFLDGAVNLVVAALMLRSGRADVSVRLNAIPGAIGPLVFLVVGLLGIVDLAGKVTPAKLAMTLAGAALMFIGTR
jgi:hypothetical protein